MFPIQTIGQFMSLFSRYCIGFFSFRHILCTHVCSQVALSGYEYFI